jgi:hypothetical protein
MTRTAQSSAAQSKKIAETLDKPIRLTSLLLVEERLLEAEHFVRRLRAPSNADRLRYELNAFLSAARSVTFLLQKELSGVPAFDEWWREQRAELRRDAAARFFLELRNYSQKEGRISLVGTMLPSRYRRARWSYRFAGTADPVPSVLLNRDVAECCREHLAKLARVVLACTEVLPYHSCPRRALTPEGVAALNIDLDAVDAVLGFPRGWANLDGDARRSERVAILQKHVDGLNFTALRRLARFAPRRPEVESFQSDFATSLVDAIEGPRGNDNSYHPVRVALAKQVLRTKI